MGKKELLLVVHNDINNFDSINLREATWSAQPDPVKI